MNNIDWNLIRERFGDWAFTDTKIPIEDFDKVFNWFKTEVGADNNYDRSLTGNARTLMDGEVIAFEQILAEGQKSTPQFNEWHDIFDLQSVCKKLGLSELEKWCVLGNRFKVIDRKKDEKAQTIGFIDWLTKNLVRKRPPSDLIYEKDKFYLWNDNAEAFNKYEELTSEQLYELYLRDIFKN